MRVLLQDRATAEFLRPEGRTKNPAEAHDFRSTLAALKFSHELGSPDLQILLKFDRDEFDVFLPVSGLLENQPHAQLGARP